MPPAVKLERLYDCSLIPGKWEQFTSITARKRDEVPQDHIMPWVRDSHIFIGILYRRYGTPAHPPQRLSGTEEEFNEALKHRDRITILSYFRTLKAADRNSTSGKQVLRMRRRLERRKVVSKEYRTVSQFQQTVMLDIIDAVISDLPDWRFRGELRRFFQFGQPETMDNARVLICYPPIHKHDPGGNQGNYDWHHRLVPNVVYEDVKAIQRIEACIRKIGIRAVKAVTTASPEVQATDYNRIWLCLPRNTLAQKRLENYQKRLHFGLQRNNQGRYDLLWRPSTRRELLIRSPLAQYLRKRGRQAKKSTWQNAYGDIVARDFAVISRFRYAGGDGARAQSLHPFWEYFIFGIRGLGTWGAGWFIYHKADKLAEIVERQGDEDIQILLQVTYYRHRIVEVVDVSSMREEYFSEQNSPEYITKLASDPRW